MNIKQITNNNINVLKNLQANENIISNRGELKINDEFIQVDNITEIEYGIYFTFHQLFLSVKQNKYNEIHQVIQDIDRCICNVYDNENLNKLIEDDEQFKMIIQEIDSKNDLIKESIYYNSPLFKFTSYIYNLIDEISFILKHKDLILFMTKFKMSYSEYKYYLNKKKVSKESSDEELDEESGDEELDEESGDELDEESNNQSLNYESSGMNIADWLWGKKEKNP